jgi:Skp family chaperone for outer membrane proteins
MSSWLRRARSATWFAFFLLAMAGSAVAQTGVPAVGSILVVDVEKLLRDSKAAKSIQQQVEQQRGTYTKDLSKQENDIRAAREELERQRTILSEQAFAGKVQEFQQKVNELRENASNKSQVLQRGSSAAFAHVLKGVEQVVVEIASERKASLVVAKNNVVVVDPSLDITEETLRRLDQRLPAVALNTSEAAPAKPASTASAPKGKSSGKKN